MWWRFQISRCSTFMTHRISFLLATRAFKRELGVDDVSRMAQLHNIGIIYFNEHHPLLSPQKKLRWLLLILLALKMHFWRQTLLAAVWRFVPIIRSTFEVYHWRGYCVPLSYVLSSFFTAKNPFSQHITRLGFPFSQFSFCRSSSCLELANLSKVCSSFFRSHPSRRAFLNERISTYEARESRVDPPSQTGFCDFFCFDISARP